MTIGELKHFLSNLPDNMNIEFKVVDRLAILEDIGVNYLTKDEDLTLVIQVS